MRIRAAVGVMPGFRRVACFEDGSVAISLEGLIANTGVERFDDRVMRGFSGLEGKQIDAMLVHPDFEGACNKLRAVVHSEAFRISMLVAGFLEFVGCRGA